MQAWQRKFTRKLGKNGKPAGSVLSRNWGNLISRHTDDFVFCAGVGRSWRMAVQSSLDVQPGVAFFFAGGGELEIESDRGRVEIYE